MQAGSGRPSGRRSCFCAVTEQGVPIDDQARLFGGDAIKYNLVVIGEAVGNLSQGCRDLEASIPWTQIKGLRNLLAHQYMHVRLETIREILTEHLEALHDAAARLRNARL